MYAVLNFHWTPSQFAALDAREKAFVVACIDERVAAERREAERMRSKRR